MLSPAIRRMPRLAIRTMARACDQKADKSAQEAGKKDCCKKDAKSKDSAKKDCCKKDAKDKQQDCCKKQKK